MSGQSLGTRVSNLKSVALTVLELLAFNVQKFRGSRDHGHAPFWGIFFGGMSGLSLETCVSNLKSVALTVLELLTFNAQKFRGHVTLATPPFGKFLGVMSGQSLGTRVSNLKSVALTVLELLAFNSHDRPLRAHTHTHTHTHTDRQTNTNERIISAIHFVHLAEIKTTSRGLVQVLVTVTHKKMNKCAQRPTRAVRVRYFFP